jgi:putative restriction endonuclease
MLFRTALLDAYGGACAFSGSSIPAALEAAHIVPWRYASPAQRLDVRNGLLLTSWHHRLFDAGLLWMDPDYRIRVDADLLAEAQGFDRSALIELDGKRMRLPAREGHHPLPELFESRQRLMDSADA